ncbi:DNA mismatch repair protein [Coemansia nantahalensis]|nr:DNA mismatch repair protein [Coemansia nantahalensis]
MPLPSTPPLPPATPTTPSARRTNPWSATAGTPASTPQKTPVSRTVRTNYKTLSLESFSFGSSPSLKRSRAQSTIDATFESSPTKAGPPELERQHTSTFDTSGGLFAAGSHSENLEPPPTQLQGRASAGAMASPPAPPSQMPAASPRLVGAPPEDPPAASASQGGSYVASQAEPRVEVRLTSILNLRKELQRGAHVELTQILSEHSFVGFVDDRQALIQHQTRLYMIDFCKLSSHLFYHRCLFDFMNYGRLLLQPAPSIHELALVAASELGHEDPERAADEVLRRFADNREMLEEYYHIAVSDIGAIESLPMVIRDYSPDYDKLPLFLYNAARSVNWDDEQQFFRTFGRALASFYALEPPLDADPQSAKDSYRLMVEHRIMPSFKGSSFWAPACILTENALVQLADLPDLYRIFERC